MRKCCLLLLPALLLTAPATGSAQIALPGCTGPTAVTAPFALVSVNGQCTDLSALITRVTGGTGWNLFTSVNLAGATIDLRVLFDPDPSITFGGTTTNPNGAATTYAFLFGLPIMPDFYTSALSTLNFTVTSPVGTTTVANSGVYPTFVSGYGSNGDELTNLDVDLGTTPCVASGIAASATCDEGSASSSFAPTYFDNLEALVTYTQDNALSTATFDGEVVLNATDVVATPEPSTLVLVVTGLVMLGATTRRRRRA